MWPFRPRPALIRPEPGPAPSRSYGKWAGSVQMLALAAIVAGWVAMPARAQPAAGHPVKIVALGDSLTAGYGLPADAAFPVRLERALTGKGLAVDVINAGVSGDTSADGLARLDWSVPDDTDAAIVELGANDALRGIDPQLTRAALDAILTRLAARRLPVLLAGMRAPPNMGAEYAKTFNTIYPDLAAAHGVLLYPFFLDGVAAEPRLNQGDGVHPTAAGVDVIVARLLPKAEELVTRARAARTP